MKHLKTFGQLNEMYLGSGYEKETIELLKKALPDTRINFDKDKDVIEGVTDGRLDWTLELGPMPGYRYGKLCVYAVNGENMGCSPVDKVEDAIDDIKAQPPVASRKMNEADVSEAKYKRAKFQSTPVQVGDVYFDYPGKPGYYNYRKIVSIDGPNADVEIWDTGFGGDKGYSRGNKHTVTLKSIQDKVDAVAKERHEQSETVNGLTHDLAEEIKLKKLKGGSLNNMRTITELKDALNRLKLAAEKFATASDSIPAGGFSGANSSTMRSSRSGKPVNLVFNDVHRGGYYGFDKQFLVQVQVGGALENNIHKAILNVAKELLSKYEYETDLGKSSVDDSSGTNWSSVMLVAPHNMKQWSPLKALES